MEIWEWTSQQLTCNLKLENSFRMCGSGCNNCKLNFENRNCCLEIWEWTSHYSTCKLNFENRNCSMEIWEWTSQLLTCKLNFENSFLDMWKWLWHLQSEFRKSKLLYIYGDLGMDLATVNLQAEFRKFLFGYLEVVVAPAN